MHEHKVVALLLERETIDGQDVQGALGKELVPEHESLGKASEAEARPSRVKR